VKEQILKLKDDLKRLAEIIRREKNKRKDYRNGFVPGLDNLRYKARHKHIVYCLLRGKTIDQIESKVRPGNEHSKYYVEQLLKEFQGADNETLCAS